MSKGIELNDDVLDKYVYGGKYLTVTNGSGVHNAEVWDDDNGCIYDTPIAENALEWAKEHAAIGDFIVYFDKKNDSVNAYEKL